MKKIKPNIVTGCMELLPNEQMIWNIFIQKIQAAYEKNGYLPMDTPIIERQETLLAKTGGETNKQIYTFEKGNTPLALRFDLTVPLARYVSEHMYELVFPFKRYQLGKVYRGEKPQKGRYREFYQLDIDIVGKESLALANDAWILFSIWEALCAIGLTDFSIQWNNRKIIEGIFLALEIQNTQEVLLLLDKYDKMEKSLFEKELAILIGEKKSKQLSILLTLPQQELFSTLETMSLQNEVFMQGWQECKMLKEQLKQLGVNNVSLQLKIVRGLDYYTGMVFETILEGYSSYGSIASGGRYANLANYYTNTALPGVGGSIGVTRLFTLLKEIGFFSKYFQDNNARSIVIPIGDTFEYSVMVWKQLRQKGYFVELDLEQGKIKKKLAYAVKKGIRYAYLIGETEQETKTVIEKDLETGLQKTVSIISQNV